MKWMGNKKTTQRELDADQRKEYKVERIQDSAVNTRELEGHLSELNYLIPLKIYSNKKNALAPTLTI